MDIDTVGLRTVLRTVLLTADGRHQECLRGKVSAALSIDSVAAADGL